MCIQADVHLQPAAPFLPYLKDLQLVGLELAIFPDALASRLCGLTALNFSHNQLERLPTSIAAITGLKALDVSKNFLQLQKGDGPLLASLSSLQHLAILSQRTRGGSESGLSPESLVHLRAFLGSSLV